MRRVTRMSRTALLFLRDELGFVQSVLRARSWLCEIIDASVLDSTWSELSAADAVLMLTLPRSDAGERIERYPETFFWRKH